MSRHLASRCTLLFLALATLIVSLPRMAWAESGSGPRPSGKYGVGRTLLYCVDPHRADPVAEDPAAKREFMVIVWYPVEADSRKPCSLDACSVGSQVRAISFTIVAAIPMLHSLAIKLSMRFTIL